jgi:hypothetical protein
MKTSHIFIAALCMLIIPFCSSAQTSESAKDDTEFSLNIARNILKAASGLSNDFANFKGDFLQKDDSGNSYYVAKDIDIGTSRQYVIMRANGAYTYAAIFEPKDDNDKTPILAFTAFTGGIAVIKENSDISVAQDPAGTQGSTLKYYLMAKDIKIASFTFDTGTKSGTLLVAIQ